MHGIGTGGLLEDLCDLAGAAGPTRPGLWIVGADARVLAGCAGAVPEPGFEVVDGRLEVRGVAAPARAATRELALPGGDRAWLVLAGDAAARVEESAAVMAGLVEREGRREWETEDTTEHLLGLFEQIRAIHDLADRLPACDSLEDKARLCLTSMTVALQCRMSVLFLERRGSEDLLGLVMGGGSNACWAVDLTLDRASADPVAQVLRTGNCVYGRAAEVELPEGSMVREAHESFLAVPIKFGADTETQVFGAILLLDRTGDAAHRGYGNPEAELVSSVGVLLGLVVGTEQRVHAEKEMKLASTIQETLVPERPPVWPGLSLASRNVAAGQVGGDYLDFVESPDRTRHAIVADVSGHNMASAMAMIMGRTRFQSVVERESSPAKIVEQLNNGLFVDLCHNELFITVFVMSFCEVFEDGGQRVRFCSAGHNPPLLLRAGGEAEWLEGGGPMVGFLHGIEYQEVETVLGPDDLVVLYTDGVVEAENEAGEMFDTAGLLETVGRHARGTAKEILEGIFQAVHRHAGPGASADDVTVIVAKVLAPSGA
ncbi:MAG: PP2C family protein-serine/threonine phosphatase [Planctomycetota bacterium]